MGQTLRQWTNEGGARDAAIRSARDGASSSGVVRPSSPARRLDRFAIRLLDIGVASVLLAVLLPVWLVLACAIKIDSPGSVLYRCRRVGRGGAVFQMLKFRKMRADAIGPLLTLADDSRFTRIGRFLARSKLDELPQLWNVLRGEMSLVGSRPESPEFVERNPDDYAAILAVRPGITGLSQLAYAKESEILDQGDRVDDYLSRVLPQKVRMDRLYAEKRSFWLNLRILAWTAIAVLLRIDVAVNRATGALGVRRRPAPTSAPEPVPVVTQAARVER
jgi:lipopolysaccharide/colanic/teichoic acid biosynthesis glycosyltransferase